MRRQFKIVPLLLMLAFCAVVGLFQAEGRRTASAQQSFAPASTTSRPHANITIRVANNSLVIKDLRLNRAGASTILKGEVFNSNKARRVNQATFEVKAYDNAGVLLRGVEGQTIFTVHRLKANASIALNSGYGVWLQGIPLDSIARLEISEINNGTTVSSLTRLVPFTNHTVDSKRFSEVEE